LIALNIFAGCTRGLLVWLVTSGYGAHIIVHYLLLTGQKRLFFMAFLPYTMCDIELYITHTNASIMTGPQLKKSCTEVVTQANVLRNVGVLTVTYMSLLSDTVCLSLKIHCLPDRKNCILITKTSRWMMFREIFYCENGMTYKSTVCVCVCVRARARAQNAEIFSECVTFIKWGVTIYVYLFIYFHPFSHKCDIGHSIYKLHYILNI